MKEAVLSSKIEGTQTQIDEALLPIEDISPERRDDWQEVNNYTIALNDAIEDLETLPISSRLISKTHATLLQEVRGEHKQPGEFRYPQKWIGGAYLTDAVFIPPTHSYVNELMGCFCIESPVLRQLIWKLRCEDYITLVAASSIIRPVVAGSGMMKAYNMIPLCKENENI